MISVVLIYNLKLRCKSDKWICQPKEGSAPKTVRICVDTGNDQPQRPGIARITFFFLAVKLNEDAEGKNIDICVGSGNNSKILHYFKN